MMRERRMETPIGSLLLQEDGKGLCGVRLAHRGHAVQDQSDTPLLIEAEKQLRAYFSGERKEFDLPLSFEAGSSFDREVWQALLRIPYGQVCTYGQLAEELGRSGAARAVGGACSRNPLLIVVPCHRVVAGSGRLTGFAAGMEAKCALLEREGWQVQSLRIRI